MPRAKKIDFHEQIYDIGNGATVTIRYDATRRPKMRHDDTIVIVGGHECSERVAAGQPLGPMRIEPRGGNLVDVDSEDFRSRAAALRGAAPAGHTPRVLTSEDNFPPGTDILGLLDASAASQLIAEE